MKKLSALFGLCLFLSSLSIAQNPFESIGKKSKPMLTLSDGRYIEYFDNDSVRQIGSAMVNVYTEQIVAFVDRKEEAKKIHAQTSSRFLSVDPLARQFPELTPYQYASNRPIDGIDLDGAEFLGAWYKVLESAVGKPTLENTWAGQVITGVYKNYTAMGLSDQALQQVKDFKNDPVMGAVKLAYPIQAIAIETPVSVVSTAKAAATGNGEAQVNLFGMVMGAYVGFKASPLASEAATPIENSVNNSYFGQTKSQLLKSQKSFQSLIEEHTQKIEEFKNDPIGNTNPQKMAEMTKDNPTPEVLMKRVMGRVSELETQLNKQKTELTKVNEALKQTN